MDKLQIFKNDVLGEIRVSIKENEVYFVGRDIAEILGYKEPHKAIERHVNEEDRMKCPILSKGGKQETWVINESGLYSLILSSNLPQAKEFKKWVTSEVLPNIRKYGLYATDNVIDNILNNPDFGIELLTTLKQEREKRKEAEKRNHILTHVNKTYTATEIAKELNLKSAKELNKILADKKVQFRVNDTWVMYSEYSNLGYEEIKQEVRDNGKIIYHRRFTGLGREFILNLLS